jgi:L-threonylcarbamoyladenylate synthase
MQTIRLSTANPSALSVAVEKALELLRAGMPVALPTETVYGLAADALNPAALSRIFETKERPLFDPLIVHLPNKEWLEQLALIPEADRTLVRALTDRFWPGPLTLVLPRTSRVPDLATSGLPTVAVRMSAHPVFAAIVDALGTPLAAPSANRFGRISPTTAQHVEKELEGKIPLIVDGGAARHGVESTIVQVHNGKLTILRAGPVTPEQLAEFAPLIAASRSESPTAPGQLKSHYAPGTPFRLLELGETLIPDPTTALLAWKSAPGGFRHTEVLSAAGELREAAATLFAKLRKLDECGADQIIAEPVQETGLGFAIMDRLRKAAARG